MAIIKSSGTEIIDYPTAHDPDEEKYYFFPWRPQTFSLNTKYYKNSVVLPPTYTGFYCICTDPGISDTASLPTFPTANRGTFTSGSTSWKCFPYQFILKPGDTIVVAENLFEGTVGTTITDTGTDGDITWCKVTAVPVATSFILTNKITILRENGSTEKWNRSYNIPITEL